MTPPPPRPRGTEPAPETDDEPPYPAWGTWFAGELERRALRNNAMLKLLNGVGAHGRYNSSDITLWKQGKKRPSEAGAMFVAAAWGLPAHTVLREAGYDDFADFLEARRPDGDPLLASIRASGLPESDQRDLERQLALMEELIAIKLEKMRRERTEAPGERETGNENAL
ncbi:hypothetical protein [Actinocrinis sp.]|uniref:hypothetical protein n=1 Tax=Actinocrinis sp. TaxID=1920516 RepID=UPI002D62080A|nr:hypothetical protein [Actinocrinis sp.]HZP55015.1 hypothetical protein [Actinocrinis sp.]